MKTGWRGSYYERESAPAQAALVAAVASGVRVELSNRVFILPFGELAQKTGFYPGEPVRLDRGDEVLVIDDRRFLDDLQQHAPQFGQTVRDPKTARSLTAIYGTMLLIIAVLVAAVWFGRGIIEDAVAAMIPTSLEERMGQATMAQVSMSSQPCTAVPLQEAVDGIVARLSSGLEARDYTYRITVLDDPAVNAFAAPGGYMAVFRGLIARTASAEELAGVLAHEMQHVAQRHSLKGMIRAAGMLTLLSLVSGDASALAGAASELSSLSFQREDEEEADREGMRALQRARLDPQAMVRMYEKLTGASPEMSGALRYLSTHPQTADRVEKLKAMAAETQYSPEPLRTSAPWNDAKSWCR